MVYKGFWNGYKYLLDVLNETFDDSTINGVLRKLFSIDEEHEIGENDDIVFTNIVSFTQPGEMDIRIKNYTIEDNSNYILK